MPRSARLPHLPRPVISLTASITMIKPVHASPQEGVRFCRRPGGVFTVASPRKRLLTPRAGYSSR